jgi:hypothetical protein
MATMPAATAARTAAIERAARTRRDRGGDDVRRVVEAVGEVEDQRDADDDREDEEIAFQATNS